MEPSLSLAPHTGKVFEAITRLECIKPFTLVGGTALSLQIAKRQSEDLDFMKWISSKKEKAEIDWPRIKNELESIGEKKSYDVMGFDYVKFDIEGVKLSFYAAPRTMCLSIQITTRLTKNMSSSINLEKKLSITIPILSTLIRNIQKRKRPSF